MLQRKQSLHSRRQFHGTPLSDLKNRDGAMNNNFEKGNGAPQFDFATFIENLITRAVFLLFRSIWGELFPVEGFLNGCINKFKYCWLQIFRFGLFFREYSQTKGSGSPA